MRDNRPIHDHEGSAPGERAAPPPLTRLEALQILSIPALFAALWAALDAVGAVPWWVPAGLAFYGTLSAWAVAAALWEGRSAAGRASQRE